MYMKYLLVYLLFLAVEGQETEAISYQIVDDEVLTITCTYDDVELCVNQDIFVKAENGFKVLITVKSLDLDGGSGDFLLIKSGHTIDDGLTGRIFTYHVNQEREYVSLTEEVLLRFHVVDGDKANFQGFVVTLEHYGEQVTTDAPTTTNRPWPIPSEDDVPYVILNVTINDENVTLSDFKEFIVELANSFVEAEGINLEEPISEDNVYINVSGCPIYWQDSNSCVKINLTLPVILAEDSPLYGTYQLNHANLLNMWLNASGYITDPRFGIYDKIPNNKRILTIWMTIICSTILLFGIIYLVSGYECTGYILKRKKLEAEKKLQNAANEKERESIISLSPHPLQHIPKLFDADVTYYNPDSPVVVRNSPARVEHHDDDALDSNTINLRHFSFNGHDDVTET